MSIVCVSLSLNVLFASAGELHVTIQAYKAELEDEISLEQGETIEVIHKLLDGWWVVRYEPNTHTLLTDSIWENGFSQTFVHIMENKVCRISINSCFLVFFAKENELDENLMILSQILNYFLPHLKVLQLLHTQPLTTT